MTIPTNDINFTGGSEQGLIGRTLLCKIDVPFLFLTAMVNNISDSSTHQHDGWHIIYIRSEMLYMSVVHTRLRCPDNKAKTWVTFALAPTTCFEPASVQGTECNSSFSWTGTNQPHVSITGNVKQCLEKHWRKVDHTIASKIVTPIYFAQMDGSDNNWGKGGWAWQPWRHSAWRGFHSGWQQS